MTYKALFLNVVLVCAIQGGNKMRDFLTYLIIKLMIIKGRLDLKSLNDNTFDARKKNEKLLMKIISRNADSAFGKKHDFKNLRSVEEFRKQIPLSDYYDYKEDIEKMINANEEDRLTSLPLLGYATTSGSTGNVKYIPLTTPELKAYMKYTLTIMMALADRDQRRKYGKGLKPGRGFFISCNTEQYLPNGRLSSNIADIASKKLGFIYPYLIGNPFRTMFRAEEIDPKYITLRFSLEDRNTMFIFGIFMSNIYDSLIYLRENWEILIDDIEKGKISDIARADEKALLKLKKYLKPDPERANELRKEFEKGFDETIIKRIWPNMTVIYGIGNGVFALFTKGVRKLAASIPIDHSIYGASEGLFASPKELEKERRLLLIDSCYYEFIPVDDENKILSLDELEPGKEYEIVITNQAGLYRYRCGDVIQVESYQNGCPFILFSYRKGHLLSITGEKTTEKHMEELIERLCKQSACEELKWAVTVDTDVYPAAYLLMLENAKGIDMKQYETFADTQLCAINPRYKNMIDLELVGKLRIGNLKPGTNEEWKQLMRDKGIAPNQIKPVTVLDNKEKEDFFFQHLI